MKNKIYLCTTVTSKDYKSWSNIPYLLHKNLEKEGYNVVNLILRELWPVKFIFNLPVRLFIKYFFLKTTYYYVRTPLHFFFTYIYSQYIRLISNPSDVMLVQGFSYPIPNGKNRMLLFGDWPSSYLFEKFLKRLPSRMEMKSVAREDRVIEMADAVVTLYPDVRDYMLRRYENKKIYYFGNVINVDEHTKISIDILDKKKHSNRLLFIGKAFYIDGANELIHVVEKLRGLGYDLHVDIVGIEPCLIRKRFDWLSIHGYLDKANLADKNKYYGLLENAKLFVNTTPGWNAFQATLEAMYFYNPIVVRPNDSLIQTFPRLDAFSYLVEDGRSSLHNEIIKSIECVDVYLQKCKQAHMAVEPHTWGSFTKKLIELIK